VSAFSQDALQKSRIDGGPNLVLAIPNVNFSKGNFTGYNFQIRGIGSKLVAGSGDAGTGIHLNNAPLISNNLFETEFYDVERVEVLRGPQGTLYGRNATGGVVKQLAGTYLL
jgi:outer membrane receptor protein involved in Fe transport